jgi:hypothetical protein
MANNLPTTPKGILGLFTVLAFLWSHGSIPGTTGSLSEFTRQVDQSGRTVVTAARFLPMLQKWIDSGGQRRLYNPERRVQMQTLFNLLLYFQQEKSVNEVPTRRVSLPAFIQTASCVDPQDPRITLSEALLHGIIFSVYVRGVEYTGNNFYLERGFSVNINMFEWDSSIFFRMRNDGWCLSELKVLFLTHNGAGIYFMSHIVRPHPNRGHPAIRIQPVVSSHILEEPRKDSMSPAKLCTPWKCSSIQLDEGTYQTKHDEVCIGTDCYDMVANEREIFRILKSGSIPLILSIDSEDEGANLTLVESGPDIAYIAISHVWSDGLGNVQRSALPRCQILRLSRLIRSLPGEASNILLFWIDTIGCPPDAAQQNETQDLAISKMRQTYEEASAVLVLDSWLVHQPMANLSNAEILMRIVNSTWNSRLWTLQEGALPKTLFFQFADGPYDLDEGVVHFKNSDDLALEYTSKSVVVQRVYEIRQFREDKIFEAKITALVAALAFRSTSVESDEALCLAALLDLDVSQIVHTPAEQRMAKFWSMLDKIPGDIIFNQSPRLKTEGFRWAPRSTLRSAGNNSGYGNMALRELNLPPAKLTPMGLLVQLPGFIMNVGECPIGDTFYLSDGHGNLYIFQNITKDADGAVEYDKGEDFPDKYRVGHSINPTDIYGSPLLGIICSPTGRQNIAGSDIDSNMAVLVSMKILVDGVLYVRHLCLSMFTRLRRGRDDFTIDKIQEWNANHDIRTAEAGGPGIALSVNYACDSYHGRLKMAFATARDSKQYWCVG